MQSNVYSHSSPDYKCPSMTPCTFTGQTMLTKVMLGDEEMHRRWDRRELVRPDIKTVVTKLVGEEYANDRVFIRRLLVNNDILQTTEQLVTAVNNSDVSVNTMAKLSSLILTVKNNYDNDKTKQRVLDQIGRDILRRKPEPTTPLEEFINDLCEVFQTENLGDILEKNDSESTTILILLYHILPTKQDLVQSLCPDFPLQKYTNPVYVKTFVKDGLASGFSDRKVNRVCFVGNQVRVSYCCKLDGMFVCLVIYSKFLTGNV